MIYINIITIEKKILIGSYHGDNDQIWSWWLVCCHIAGHLIALIRFAILKLHFTNQI
ncbi:hypothetical protein AO382_2241 [Moraxella catarrhalis]|uniref:Uncharacterized protein n=1 Tax=Moraxella catarrhalis TaxID=480 RepID=A0A7Z0UWP2_MORCA|nr:hypothetical protein AO382_2241 [Moraxella catarrhalis]